MLYRTYGKRILDFVIALLGCCILLLPIALIALLVILTDPGKAFFSQERIGQNGTKFKMYKFRTMKMDAPHDVPTHLLKNPDQYITPIGAFLRKTSLDELPQIWNVLKGDMAIVGPRPALWNQYDLIAQREQYHANSVRPGLTGWAQINGRDRLTIQQKAKLDGDYIEKMSFFFDCRCFLGTFFCVARQEDIVEGVQAEQTAYAEKK